MSPDGEVIGTDDVLEWGRFFESGTSIIARTDIGDIRISTVFLGLDHNYGGGPPLLFETMIFGGEHDEYQERYTTREEAEMGHLVAVSLVQDSINEQDPENEEDGDEVSDYPWGS